MIWRLGPALGLGHGETLTAVHAWKAVEFMRKTKKAPWPV